MGATYVLETTGTMQVKVTVVKHKDVVLRVSGAGMA